MVQCSHSSGPGGRVSLAEDLCLQAGEVMVAEMPPATNATLEQDRRASEDLRPDSGSHVDLIQGRVEAWQWEEDVGHQWPLLPLVWRLVVRVPLHSRPPTSSHQQQPNRRVEPLLVMVIGGRQKDEGDMQNPHGNGSSRVNRSVPDRVRLTTSETSNRGIVDCPRVGVVCPEAIKWPPPVPRVALCRRGHRGWTAVALEVAAAT